MDLDIIDWVQSSQSTQPLNRETTEAPSRSETMNFRHEFLGESSYKKFKMSNVFGSTITLGVKKLVRIWLDVHAVKEGSLRFKRLHLHTCSLLYLVHVPLIQESWEFERSRSQVDSTEDLLRYHQCSSWLLWVETHYNSFWLEMGTPLWREAHLQVKMYKTPQARTTFWSSDVQKIAN